MSSSLFVTLLLVVLIVIYIWVFQYSWNNTFPEIFGIKRITLLQAFLLLLLAGMIFGSSHACNISY